MDRRAFIALSASLPALAAMSCARTEKNKDTTAMYESHEKIFKQSGVLIPRPNETTPVVHEGKLLALSTPREGHSPVCIEVRDYHSGQVLAAPPWSGIFGTFTTDDAGVIHAWGASGGGGLGNQVLHSVLGPDFAPSSPDVAWSANPQCDRVWNTSVCKGSGVWVMALETLYPELLGTPAGFNIIFNAADTPYGPWRPLGWHFNYRDASPARLFEAYCPTIKFHDGWYYLFYMKPEGQSPKLYYTFVARSQTLQPGSWQFSQHVVLAPDGPSEQTNASDFDFVEHGGACWGTYFAGNQIDSGPVKRCMYPGSEAQFLSEFF